MTDDNDNLSSIADYYASQGMSNPQLSYDQNGNPIFQSNKLPVDISNLQDYAATLPVATPNPLPTHETWINPIAKGSLTDALTGLGGGERYQLFPERIARSAFSLPTDVMSGKVQTPVSGGNKVLSSDEDSEDELLQRVQDMAALMGGGGLATTSEATLGSGLLRRMIKDRDGNELTNYHGDPIQPGPDGKLTLYHRTNEDAANAIKNTGKFQSKENTDETFFADNIDSEYGKGFGDHVVAVKVDPKYVRLNDQFPSGENHYAVPNKFLSKANILKSDNEAAAPIAALEKAPVFHSAVENAVNTASLKSAPPQQWLSTIANAKGVKPEELDWTGLKDFLQEQKGPTREELERMPIDKLDKMAYGHSQGEIVKLNPKDIKIKYPDDLVNPQDKFDKQGMKWVKSVDQTEPVKVSIDQDGKFNLEDGHHRWFAANKLNQPVTAEVEKITGKPIETILARKPQITKEQIQQHLEGNKVELKEVNKGKTVQNRQEELEAIHPDERTLQQVNELEDIHNGMWDGEPAVNSSETKYSKYQLPGGENYREKLLTLPNKNDLRATNQKQYEAARGNVPAMQAANAEGARIENEVHDYKSSHWDEPNVLAHIRMNDRFIPDENGPSIRQRNENQVVKYNPKIHQNEERGYWHLHIEEIQSDWHQQGREQGYKITDAQKKELESIDNKLTSKLSEGDIGNLDMDAVLKTAVEKKVITSQEAKNYKDWSKGENSNIPDAPFKKTWLDLAAKRMIREAAEQGKDVLSWTPGEAQAARYDLSKHIKRVELTDNSSGGIGRPKMEGHFEGGMLHAYDHNGKEVIGKYINNESELAEHIGKEAAEKLMNVKPIESRSSGFGVRSRKLVDQDLKVGGEGMHYFYDKMLPAVLEKLTGQKMKVGSVDQTNTANKLVIKNTGRLGINGNEIHGVYEPDGTLLHDFRTKEDAEQYVAGRKAGAAENPKAKINYIDLPQSVKDTALHRGFPLFSSGLMLNPVQDNPFAKSKYKLVPVDHDPFKEKK